MYIYEFRENPIYVFSNKMTLFSFIHILGKNTPVFNTNTMRMMFFLIIATILHTILRKCITLYNKIIA